MPCQKCNSARIVHVHSSPDDRNNVKIEGGKWEEGYLPYDIGINGGSNLEISYCLECGQIQGEFPLPLTELEGADSD